MCEEENNTTEHISQTYKFICWQQILKYLTISETTLLLRNMIV